MKKYDLEYLKGEVSKKVSEKRFAHILGVEKKAIELGKINNLNDEDIEKLRVAAILHDEAKYMKKEELEKIIRENFKELNDEDIKLTPILHGFIGSLNAKKIYNIEDESIINAIKYHTIGKKDLDIIGRIIYIADAIEDGRDYPGVEELRKKVMENLDLGIIAEIEKKEKYLKETGGKSHKNTEEMKKWLIDKEARNER